MIYLIYISIQNSFKSSQYHCRVGGKPQMTVSLHLVFSCPCYAGKDIPYSLFNSFSNLSPRLPLFHTMVIIFKMIIKPLQLENPYCYYIKNLLFIPRHTLVTGYYVFTLAVRVSVRPSVVHTSVRPSALHFRSIA